MHSVWCVCTQRPLFPPSGHWETRITITCLIVSHLDCKNQNQVYLATSISLNVQFSVQFPMISDDDNKEDDDDKIIAVVIILKMTILAIIICTYYLPGSVLNDFHVFFHFILTTMLQYMYYEHSHFIDRGLYIQRSY